jgi:YD repeat-containing protein
MKTKHYINFFIALTLALSACKKNSGGDAPAPSAVKKYLVQSTIKFQAPGIGLVTTTTNITYDSKKRKQTEKTGTSTFTYAYYDNDKLFSSTQTFADGNGLRFYTEYKYTGDLLAQTKKVTYKNNDNTGEVISNYIYNSSNQLTEIDYYLGFVTTYTYDSHGDAVKVVDKQDSMTFTYEYTYDANHRILTKTITGADPAVPNAYAYTYDSHNNVTKLATTTGTTTKIVNTTYVYDADGYMTSYTADDGGSGSYTYSTLQ